MSFTTKKYTINYLYNEVAALSNNQVSNFETFAETLSPRAGRTSAKLYTLNRYLNGNLRAVFSGQGGFRSYGKTARTRVLTALRNRKTSR